MVTCSHCGKEFRCRRDDFISGKVNSCGCQQGRGENNFVHGLSKHKLYPVHSMMKQRCSNKNHPQYKDWGGRGITVCDEWKDFKPFYDWATANGYREGLEIDRIDNNGNYEPANCRWATREVQANNTRAVERAKHIYETKYGKYILRLKGVDMGTFNTYEKAKKVRDEVLYLLEN